MSNLSDRVAFIQGLAEGMNIKDDTNEGKLLLKMLDVLGEMAGEIKRLSDAQEEMSEYVESIDDDLADIEETLYGDEDEDGCDCAHCHGGDDDDDDDEDEDDDGMVEYTCPSCGHVMTFAVDEFDFDEDYLCPECNKPLFPEGTEE